MDPGSTKTINSLATTDLQIPSVEHDIAVKPDQREHTLVPLTIASSEEPDHRLGTETLNKDSEHSSGADSMSSRDSIATSYQYVQSSDQLTMNQSTTGYHEPG